MNIHALRLFFEAAERGSVTKAAEAAHISQPAVSMQLRNLEKELGMALLAPKGRSFALTEAGSFLHTQARRLFALEAEIESGLRDYAAGRYGKVRIAATYLPANFLLPGWVAAAKSGTPEVDFEVTITNSQTAYEMLLAYKADLAVIGGRSAATLPSEPKLCRELLFEDDVCFIVPASHRLAGRRTTLEEMMREPFVMREPGSSMRELLLSCCRVRGIEPPRIALQLSGLNETIRAAIAGCGAVFASSLEVQDYVRRGDVATVHVADVQLVNPISLCTRENDPLSPPADRFVQEVRALSQRVYPGGNDVQPESK